MQHKQAHFIYQVPIAIILVLELVADKNVHEHFQIDAEGFIGESFINFDTSGVPANATISSAVCEISGASENEDDDFDIQVRLHNWGPTLTTSDWVINTSLSGKTLLAHLATTSFGTGYNTFVDDAFAANVVKAGTTYVLLNSSRHLAGTPVTAGRQEWVRMDTGSATNKPKLTVTYTTGSTGFTGMVVTRELRG